MSAADMSTVPSGPAICAGIGGAPWYVSLVASPSSAKVTTATPSKVHLRTFPTGSEVLSPVARPPRPKPAVDMLMLPVRPAGNGAMHRMMSDTQIARTYVCTPMGSGDPDPIEARIVESAYWGRGSSGGCLSG